MIVRPHPLYVGEGRPPPHGRRSTVDGVGGSSVLFFRGALCAWAVGGRSVGSFCRSFTVLLGRYAVLLWLRVSGPVVGFVAWPAEGSRW